MGVQNGCMAHPRDKCHALFLPTSPVFLHTRLLIVGLDCCRLTLDFTSFAFPPHQHEPNLGGNSGTSGTSGLCIDHLATCTCGCGTAATRQNVQLWSLGSDPSWGRPDGESERGYYRLSGGHHGHWYLFGHPACLYAPDEDRAGVSSG